MPPICHVARERYIPAPQPHISAVLGVQYLGHGLRREERLSNEGSSDWVDTIRVRSSDDNGRSWSDWELQHREWPTQSDCTKEQMPFCNQYDPRSGRTVQMVFQRVLLGDPEHALAELWKGRQRYYDHGFWQVSADDGRTWGDLHQLTYEDGPVFDPENWGNPAFLTTNEMYGGYNLITLRNGNLIYPATIPVPYHDEEDRVVADLANHTGREDHVAGVRCFIGRWNPQRTAYEWTASDPVLVPRRVSWRGLLEPVVAELTTGAILLEMRGSNTKITPGRKWIAVSKDGGHSWSPVTDLRYDDGEQFYAPSSFARMIRHSRTGVLYWVGNISAAPPDRNSPRYPLYIAEVDETIPALKRETLTVIDDYDPGHDTPLLQLSNFSLFENRETGEFEAYLTRYGERGDGKSHTGDFWTADVYKYVLTF